MLVAAHMAAAALATGCPPTVANDLRTPPSAAARQLITIEAATTQTTYATARIWRRSGDCWVPADGPYAARVGRNGLRASRREGDGTTPIGTFPIGDTMYGSAPNPGVRFRYMRLHCGDWWVEDPASPEYNTFQRVGCNRRPPFKVTTPDMSKSPRAYAHLAVIEFNMHPIIPGRGSGIFLHAQTGGATNGCVSLARPDLVHVLRWLSSAATAQIAIGTRTGLRRR
jgi:L,D-peptidoglycan transpeptidase YkuD (ErfK/YbiS/YcfS/YnhG family)